MQSGILMFDHTYNMFAIRFEGILSHKPRCVIDRFTRSNVLRRRYKMFPDDPINGGGHRLRETLCVIHFCMVYMSDEGGGVRWDGVRRKRRR